MDLWEPDETNNDSHPLSAREDHLGVAAAEGQPQEGQMEELGSADVFCTVPVAGAAGQSWEEAWKATTCHCWEVTSPQ